MPLDAPTTTASRRSSPRNICGIVTVEFKEFLVRQRSARSFDYDISIVTRQRISLYLANSWKLGRKFSANVRGASPGILCRPTCDHLCRLLMPPGFNKPLVNLIARENTPVRFGSAKNEEGVLTLAAFANIFRIH